LYSYCIPPFFVLPKLLFVFIMSFSIVKNLGAGSNGCVDLVRDESRAQFALKTVAKKKDQPTSKYILREIEVGKTVKHPGVAAALKTWEDEENFYFLMEYIKGMDLITMMEAREGAGLSESSAKDVFTQILEGLTHVHSKGIAHRDIKLDNIMIDVTGKVKIIDFGLCKTGGADECDGRIGSTEYCAPEVFQTKKTYNGYMADVWSTGVVLFALLFGCFPFTSNDIRLLKMGIDVSIHFPPSTVSAEAKNLVKKMLTVNPKKRISMKKIYEHEWVRK